MKRNRLMLSKITISVGILLIVSGVILTVCSMPVLPVTGPETHHHPIPESSVIMNYSFSLPGNASYYRIESIYLRPWEDLHIRLSGNKSFDLAIVKYNGGNYSGREAFPDATYLTLTNDTSVNTIWGPQTNDTYYLRFYSEGATYSSPCQIVPYVTKNWMGVYTWTENVTRPRSLVNTNFGYVGLGIIALGVLIPLVTSDRVRKKTMT